MAPLAEAFVRVRAQTDRLRRDVNRDFEGAGREGSRSFEEGFNNGGVMRNIRRALARSLGGNWQRQGGEAGRAFGDGFTRDAQGRLHDQFGRYTAESRHAGGDAGDAFGGSFARNANRSLRGVSSGLRGLRTGVLGGTAAVAGLGTASAGVFAGMGAGIAGVAAGIAALGVGLALQNDQLKKTFTDTFGAIKKQAVTLAAPFVGPLQKVAGIIRSTFGAIAPELSNAFKAVAPALVPFAQGIAGMVKALSALFVPLAQVGAKILAGLGPALETFGAQLVQFFQPILAALNKVGTNLVGTLIGGIGNLLVALAPLLGVLIEVGSTLLGPLLQALTTVAGALAQALIPVIRAIAPVFTQLVGALAPLISQLVSGLAPILVALAPILGQVFAILRPVISALISGLQPVIAALVPVVGLLVGALGQVIGAVVPLLVPLGQLIANLVNGLLPVLTPIISLIAQTAATILGALVQALVQAMPALQSIVLAVAQLLPLLLPLLPAFSQLVLAVVPLVPVVANLAAMLVGYLVPVLRLVITVVVKIVTTVVGLLVPVLKLAVSIITWVASIIQPILTAVGVAVQAVGRWAMWLWTTAIGPAFRGIAAVATWLWVNVLGPAFRGIVAVGKWLATAIIVAVVAPIMVQFKIWAAVVKWLWSAVFSPVFKAIAAVVKWSYQNVIKPILSAFIAFIRGVLVPVIRWLYNNVVAPVFRSIGAAIRTAWHGVISPVFNALKSAIGRVGGAFRSGATAIKSAWDKIKGYTRSPVNFVIGTVYNKGIRGLWNHVLDWLHIKGMRLGSIPLLASGGTLDNPTAAAAVGKTNKPTAIVGEGRTSHPEFVIPTDPAHRARAQALWAAAGSKLQMLAGGGVLGGVLGGIKKAASKVMDVGKLGLALLDDPREVFDGLVAKLPSAAHLATSPFGTAIAAIPKRLVGTAWDALKSVIDAFKKGFGGGGSQAAVNAARTYIGTPYVWGGTSHSGIDCSGLTMRGWLDGAHKNITRTTYTQRQFMKTIPGPRPGAVGQPHPGHTYMASRVRGGRTWVVEAAHSGTRVSEHPLSRATPWWGYPPGMASGGALVKGLGQKFIRGRGAGWQIAKWLGLAGDPGGVVRGFGPIIRPTSFDSGGLLQRGLSVVHNGTRRPEHITTDEQWSALMRLAERGAGRPIEIHNHGLPGIPSDQQITSSVDKALIMHGGW